MRTKWLQKHMHKFDNGINMIQNRPIKYKKEGPS